MDKSELISFIDFEGVYKEIRKEFLIKYPTSEEYKKFYSESIMSFESFEQNTSLKWIDQLYSFLLSNDHDEYLAKLEINEDDYSLLDLNSEEIEITFQDYTDTSTENGSSCDCYSFTFKINVKENLFTDYNVENYST